MAGLGRAIDEAVLIDLVPEKRGLVDCRAIIIGTVGEVVDHWAMVRLGPLSPL